MKRADVFLSSIYPVTENDPVPAACARLVDYIISHHKQLSEMLSFRDLSNIAGIPIDSADLIRLISLATSGNVLRWKFTYVSDESPDPLYLNDEDSAYFIKSGIVRDHNSGIEVGDVADHVYPYFVANVDFLRSEVK